MFRMFKRISSNLSLQQKKTIERISVIGCTPLLLHRISFTLFGCLFGTIFLKRNWVTKVVNISFSHIIYGMVIHLIFLTACYFSCANLLRDLVKSSPIGSSDPAKLVKTANLIEKQIKGVNRISGDYFNSFLKLKCFRFERRGWKR